MPYINLIVAIFYLAHPESKKRGLQMLALTILVSCLWSVAGWVFFAGTLDDTPLSMTLWAWFDKFTASADQPYWIWKVLLALMVPFLGVRYVQGRRLAHAWRTLAERTGLTYQPAGILRGSVTGTYHGRPLQLYTYNPLTDNVLDVTCLALSVDNASNLRMRLEYTPMACIMDKFLRSKNTIQTGDDTFDVTFVIHSESPRLARQILASPKLRQNLFRLREYTTLDLSHTTLSLESTGREKDPDYVHFCFDLLSALADVIEHIEK